jgi:hypothetical protein
VHSAVPTYPQQTGSVRTFSRWFRGTPECAWLRMSLSPTHWPNLTCRRRHHTPVASQKVRWTVNRKELNYQSLAATHTFIPLAFKTIVPINSKDVAFFNQLGSRLVSSRFAESRFAKARFAESRFAEGVGLDMGLGRSLWLWERSGQDWNMTRAGAMGWRLLVAVGNDCW